MATLASRISEDRLSQCELLIDQRQDDLPAVSPVPSNSSINSHNALAEGPLHCPDRNPWQSQTDEPVPLQGNPHSSNGDPDHYQQNDRSRTVWDRVGRMASVVLVGGTLFLLSSIGFLIYLWVEAKRATSDQIPTSLWEAIANADRMTQSVTITAAVMRTVMAALAALTTAMIAALYLESFGTRYKHLPLLSMMRTVTVSPLALITTGKLVFASSSSRGLASGLVIVTSLLAVISQLISTILVSDFASSTIPAIMETGPVTNASGAFKGSTSHGYLFEPPGAYWRFAEWQGEPAGERTRGNTEFTDTGVTFRASLPWWNEKDRTGLRFFSGETLVWDAGVACFCPNISEARVSDESLRVKFNINDRHPRYPWSTTLVSDDSPYQIFCGFPPPSSFVASAVLCKMRDLGESLRMAPVGLVGVFRFDATKLIMDPLRDNVLGGNTSQDWSVQKQGPWIRLLNGIQQEAMSLSVCVTSSAIQKVEVTVSGAPTISEPVFNSEGDPGSFTQQIRRQMGVPGHLDVELHSHRGILAMHAPPPGPRQGIGIGPWHAVAMTNESQFFGPLREDISQMAAHWTHSFLFMEILNATNNPAFAIQSLTTVLFQMQIFNKYPSGFRNATASYLGSRDAEIPIRNIGLMFVVGLVSAHLIFVVLISLLFLSRTKSTLLGNAWQSIAHVVSEKTYEALQAADNSKDKEFEVVLGKQEANQAGVLRLRHNGRQEFGPKTEP